MRNIFSHVHNSTILISHRKLILSAHENEAK